MFDNLFIDNAQLPITKDELFSMPKKQDWQTKSLECILTEVYITKDGRLKIDKWVYEDVPKQERPYPKDKGLMGWVGSIRRTGERIEFVTDVEIVNFYDDINGTWMEFDAHFKEGKLINIERI